MPRRVPRLRPRREKGVHTPSTQPLLRAARAFACGHGRIARAHTHAHTHSHFHARHPHSCIQDEADAPAKEDAALPRALPSADAPALELLKDDNDKKQSTNNNNEVPARQAFSNGGRAASSQSLAHKDAAAADLALFETKFDSKYAPSPPSGPGGAPCLLRQTVPRRRLILIRAS